jgi:hypothetical protein
VVLAALLVSLAASVASAAYALVRGVALWRQAKGTARALGTELARFDERAARTEHLLQEAEVASRELEAALARLRASRKRLAVLLRALERARSRTRWLRAFLPV